MGKLKIYCDGGSRGNPGPGACAFVVFGENGNIIARRAYFLGRTTNNQAEYQAVLLALSFLLEKHMRPLKIFIFLDSELVANQLTGKYKIRDKNLQTLALKVKGLEGKIKSTIKYLPVPRKENKLADLLVNKALDQKRNIF